MFASATCGLVYITALPSRSLLSKYLPVIAWETEVWVSESPSHLIHFNGDKFLGPHENTKA
jgi:adenine-specific DNA-methyltransferase